MSSQAEREYDALYDDFEKVRVERDALAQRCRELQHAPANDLLTRLLEQLDASNAENYYGVEFDVELGSEQMTAIVMLQRRGHPSAHDLRLRAEQERDQLRAEREALTQRCAELEQCMSEPLNKLVRERDTLRAEVERLRQALRSVIVAAGGVAEPGVSTEFLEQASLEVLALRGNIDQLQATLRELLKK